MLNGLFSGTTMPMLEQAARFAEKRHEVLAGNIANISTPGYLVRDLPVSDFQSALRRAVKKHETPPQGPGTGQETANWSFSPSPGDSDDSNTLISTPNDGISEDLFVADQIKTPGLTFNDGNNRSMETEFNELTKNSLYQSAAIELLMAQMNRLQAVISERA